MKKIIGLLTIVVFLTNCNNNGKANGGWARQDEDKWMDLCMKGSTDPKMKGICTCVLQKIEKKYATYQDADKNGTEEQGREMGMECATEQNKNGNNTNNNNNNNGGLTNGVNNNGNNGGNNNTQGWSRQDESNWMDLCMKGSTDNPQMKSICSCVLQKIEKKYATYQEADKYGTEEEGKEMGTECANEVRNGNQ